jgi:D-galactarolactone isomerase
MARPEALTRQTFLERAAGGVLAAAAVTRPREATAQIAVPNSSRTQPSQLKAPPRACDCHMHIYDPARFPMLPNPARLYEFAEV